MKEKLLKIVCKLFGYSLFKHNETYQIVSNHSVKRIEERMDYRNLLRILAEQALKDGTKSIHFEYQKSQINEYARLYKGYIFVFSKEKDSLITLYRSEKIVDLIASRK